MAGDFDKRNKIACFFTNIGMKLIFLLKPLDQIDNMDMVVILVFRKL